MAVAVAVVAVAVAAMLSKTVLTVAMTDVWGHRG